MISRLYALLFAFVVLVPSTMLMPRTVDAQTHFGFLSYWDGRIRSDITGSRHRMCNPASTTCLPGTTGCCWSMLGAAKVYIYSQTAPFPMVGDGYVDDAGLFMIEVNPPFTGDTFFYVEFATSPSVGFPLEMRRWGQVDPYGVVIFPDSQSTLSNGNVFYATVELTAPGDNTSWTSDISNAWQAILDTVRWLRNDNETRMDNGNQYTVTVLAGSGTSNSGENSANLYSASVRDFTPSHEVAHAVNRRLMGGVAFPSTDNYGLAHSWGFGIETANLREAYAYLVENFARFNPQTASFLSIVRELAGNPAANADARCVSTASWDHSNDVAVVRNSWLALWDFIDADTAHADLYQDYFDLDVSDLGDALISWHANVGTQGQNRSRSEHYLDQDARPCSYHSDCSGGYWCIGDGSFLASPVRVSNGRCRNGDVPGENLRDWIQYFTLDGGRTDTQRWQTLVSSPCVGPADDTHPYTGGYSSL